MPFLHIVSHLLLLLAHLQATVVVHLILNILLHTDVDARFALFFAPFPDDDSTQFPNTMSKYGALLDDFKAKKRGEVPPPGAGPGQPLPPDLQKAPKPIPHDAQNRKLSAEDAAGMHDFKPWSGQDPHEDLESDRDDPRSHVHDGDTHFKLVKGPNGEKIMRHPFPWHEAEQDVPPGWEQWDQEDPS